MGGIPMLRKVNKIFYDKIYAHPWIGQYFKSIRQEHIENQQTDFMTQALGGPEIYSGRFVPDAHTHMFITEELFLVRNGLLLEALREAGAPQELHDRWTKIDLAFKKNLIKNSLADCTPRFRTDDILDFPNPEAYKKAA